MARNNRPILEQFAAQAVRLGADELEVEHKDRHEEIFAMKSGLGLGIASLRSSSPKAWSLLNELYALTKKKRRVTIGDCTYELRARMYDSFGGDAFRVELHRMQQTTKRSRKPRMELEKEQP